PPGAAGPRPMVTPPHGPGGVGPGGPGRPGGPGGVGPGGPGKPPMGPGAFGPPPRKKKSPLVPILLGGGGALLLLIIIIVVVAAASNSGGSSSSTSSYSYSYSSHSSYSAPSSSFSYSSFNTSDEPTSTESSPDNGGGGYGPPESNKLYKTSAMKSVHCNADLGSTAAGPYRRYANEVAKCLSKSWAQVFASQGMSFHPAKTVVSNSKNPSSPCGSNAGIGYVPIAFYCSANETMYFSVPGAQQYSLARRGNREYIMGTAAHEYGHHIQTLYGLWPYFNQRYNDAYPKVSEYTQINRRMELQPQCFAGMFLGRNRSTMNFSAANMRYNFFHQGDNYVPGVKSHPQYRTHGQNYNSGYWFNHGDGSGRAGTCNTWTAPASRVA
ncbi:MAG: neutral zinc metallopeptidase, partial [Streptosporangiales bacterium]|nr:neutral zinc metallopeptidase [Streptosporangiales bacterium]